MPAIVTSAVIAAERGGDAAAPAADVVVVHRLATARCRCWRRSAAPASRRGTRGTTRPRSDRRRTAPRRPGGRGRSAAAELELGAVAHLPDPARDRHAARAARRRARRRSSRRRASCGSASIARICSVAQRDLLGGGLRADARSPPRAARARGYADGPLEHAHAAHRAADDRVPPVDAERVGERGLDRRPGRGSS